MYGYPIQPKTRAIASAKIKTDKLDSIKLADLLSGGYIAECYVPTKETMDLRELVRHRAALVRMRTKLKNKIHSIMLMNGTSVSYVGTHIFTLQMISIYLGSIMKIQATLLGFSKNRLKEDILR